MTSKPQPPSAEVSISSRLIQLMLLTLVAAASMYARTAVSPLQEAMRVALGLGDNQMALLQGPALALPMIVAAIPLGLLIDRVSRVRLLLIFTALSLLGTWLTAWASTFELLFAARALVGLSATATGTTAFSLLADLYAPQQRGRATLVVAIGQFAGSSLAFALGGAFLGAAIARAQSWQAAMLWLSAPLVIVTLSILAMREPVRSERTLLNPSARAAFTQLWTYRAVIAPLLLGLVTMEVALQSALVWTAPALTRGLALSAGRVGQLMGMGLIVSGVVGPLAGGSLADLSQRTGGPRRSMGVLGALALLSAPAALFSVIPDMAAASILVVIFFALITALLVMGTALFTIVVPNELRGLCLSIFASATLIFGVGLGPLGVSLLSGALGGSARLGLALSSVGCMTSVLAAGIFIFGRREFPCIA